MPKTPAASIAPPLRPRRSPVVRPGRMPPFASRPPAGGELRGAEITGEKLLVAAHELLCERRGGDVSIAEVCARAGANIAMIKYCFGSKDAMMLALLERIMRDLAAQLDGLDRAKLTPTIKLRRHV